MGIFDFFKKDKAKPAPTVQVEQDTDGSVKHETKLVASEVTKDAAVMERIVEKIVAEDPFQKFYRGMTERDFGPGSRRVFEYTDITTMNVAISDNLEITIEGIPLGVVPTSKAAEVKKNRDQYVWTAYVYVTGGRYKEYSTTENAVVEGSVPYNLDIFIQFT